MAEDSFADRGPTHGLTPYLTVKGGKDAIAFYEAAFGAVTLFVMPAQDGGRVMHAHLSINGGALMLSDDFPEWTGGMKSPASVTLHLQVDRLTEEGLRLCWPTALSRRPRSCRFWPAPTSSPRRPGCRELSAFAFASAWATTGRR